MAVLTPVLTPADGFAGSPRVLEAHGRSLPQPDQLCGPFAATTALYAVLESPPSVVDVALAAGSLVWRHDVPEWRPAGAPLLRTGWDVLPGAPAPGASGTTGEGVATGVESATHGKVRVVPVSGADVDLDRCARLLTRLLGADRPVGVVANVRTGALDAESPWDVGHFVVLWGWRADSVRPVVGVADTYVELGSPGSPPGCREVTGDALVAGISAAPGRGLLVLVAAEEAPVVRSWVTQCGLRPELWRT